MKKKLLFLAASVCLILIVGLFFVKPFNQPQNSQSSTPPTSPAETANMVILNIDYGNGNTTSYEEPMIENQTAFGLLKNATDKNNIKLEYKQYDFGVLIETINGVANSKDKAWIYFVNGKSANVGADKYQLKPGDTVEWKYITPSGN